MFLGGRNLNDRPINVHQSLRIYGVPYIAYPPPTSSEVVRYKNKCSTEHALRKGDTDVVFLGQVPHLLPIQFIPWALDLLLETYGVQWVLQTENNGAAKAWLEPGCKERLLKDLNKHLVFDICGVWIARTSDQKTVVDRYMSRLQLSGPVDTRIPRHALVIDNLRPPKNQTTIGAQQLMTRERVGQLDRSSQFNTSAHGSTMQQQANRKLPMTLAQYEFSRNGKIMRGYEDEVEAYRRNPARYATNILEIEPYSPPQALAHRNPRIPQAMSLFHTVPIELQPARRNVNSGVSQSSDRMPQPPLPYQQDSAQREGEGVSSSVHRNSGRQSRTHGNFFQKGHNQGQNSPTPLNPYAAQYQPCDQGNHHLKPRKQ